MFDKTDDEKKVSRGKKKRAGEKEGGYQVSDFISLDDLVYAPLHALAKSNQQLRNHVVESIKGLGTTRQEGTEEIVQLNNMNIAYNQIHPDSEGHSVDKMQLEVPLLSIVPVTNMNVDRAEIDFSTEVLVIKKKDGEYSINGRICSPEPREGDFLPRVTYKLSVNSIAASEGLMRLTDILNTNQVARKRNAIPMTPDGKLGTEAQAEWQQSLSDRRMKIKKLRKLYRKVTDMIEEQEKLYEIGRDTCENDTYTYDKDRFRQAQSDIMNEIMELKEEIMTEEIRHELEEKQPEQEEEK